MRLFYKILGIIDSLIFLWALIGSLIFFCSLWMGMAPSPIVLGSTVIALIWSLTRLQAYEMENR